MKLSESVWAKKINQWFFTSGFESINRQSYIRLDSSFQNVEEKLKDDPKYKHIKEQLQNLKDEPDWNSVKSIELLMIPFLTSYDLEIELAHLLHKVKTLFSEHDYNFFIQQFELISSDSSSAKENKRALLTTLTVSVHKYYEDRQLRSLFANKARLKIGFFFSIAIFFSVFLLAIGILHPDGIYQYCTRYCPQSDWLNSITMGVFGQTETQQKDQIHLHFAITALVAGGMGACFSMLISLKTRIETVTLQELNNIHNLHFILTRIITGIGAALICYYFFRAELLSGSLFPDFRDEKTINLTSKSFFTLIIWCFIAGFSEKLVPSILSKTEGQVDKK